MQVEETTPSTSLRPTRAGFVRGLPLTMPVEEVIERGREAGLELQPSDIHAARYYMRQQGAGDSASIPQQLMLGGTFVSKPQPTRRIVTTSDIRKPVDATATASAGTTTAKEAEAPAAPARLFDPDYDDDVETEAPAVVAPITKRGRGKKADTKLAKQLSKAEAKAEAKAGKKVTNGLHTRLQARLRNATFRDTSPREERETRDSRESRESRAERVERQTRATISKALQALDNAVKPKSKRAQQTADALEADVKLIALRIGTQRVREILDGMEELAKRA
jgi:hypothetical protein